MRALVPHNPGCRSQRLALARGTHAKPQRGAVPTRGCQDAAGSAREGGTRSRDAALALKVRKSSRLSQKFTCFHPSLSSSLDLSLRENPLSQPGP